MAIPRIPIRLAILSISIACAAAAPGTGGKATTLAPSAPVEAPRVTIVSTRSLPPQFNLTLEIEMPTPGWTFTVDSLEIDEANLRITAKVTEASPAGMVAQVITPTSLRLALGELAPGAWVFELRTRRNPTVRHRASFVTILLAS